MSWNQLAKVLDALIDVVATTTLHEVVGLSATLALGFLGRDGIIVHAVVHAELGITIRD